MSYVLAIEPHRGQARVLRDIIGRNSPAEVIVVGSVESAMAAIEREMPRLILLNALLPPREENDLVEHLRRVPKHAAPEILITPALDGGPEESASSPRGLFSRRQRRSPRPAGNARAAFLDQVSTYLSLVDARDVFVEPAATIEPDAPVEAEVIVDFEAAPDPSGRDRRASVRFEDVDWARVRINGTPVKVVDLSFTGAQILSPSVLRLGGSVHVMLSRNSDIVQCDAGIVWGAFDINQAGLMPSFRAGLRFKDADRHAVERLCLDPFRLRDEDLARVEGALT